MTDADFKAAITFAEREDEYGLYRKILARVSFGHEMTVSHRVFDFADAVKHAREVATEALFRKVYEDRRKDLFDAIDALHRVNPLDGSYFLQVDKILAIAKRQ